MPIYWAEKFKTKPDKVHLIGMNFFRNAHYHTQNKLKQELEQSLKESFNESFDKITTSYKVHYTLYYKNPACDGSNIIALSEKIFLDFLQSIDLVTNDNVKYHLGSSWSIGGCDKLNPRVEITLKEYNDPTN
jgi:endonuclease IV